MTPAALEAMESLARHLKGAVVAIEQILRSYRESSASNGRRQ